MSTPNPTFPPGMTSFPPNSQPWRDDSKYQSKVFYCYESDNVANLAAAAAVNLTFNIAGDSDFFWTKFCAFALVRSEEHTSELQSQFHLVCRLLLEKKKKNTHLHMCLNKKKNNTKHYKTNQR